MASRSRPPRVYLPRSHNCDMARTGVPGGAGVIELSSAEVIYDCAKKVRHMASRPQTRPSLVVSRGNNNSSWLAIRGIGEIPLS